MILRFDLDTGLVRKAYAHAIDDPPMVSKVAKDLEEHLQYRARAHNLLDLPPSSSSEQEEQKAVRLDLRYHNTPITLSFARLDWTYQASIPSDSDNALHVELRAVGYLDHGGHDHGPPLVAAMMEFGADRALLVRVSRAKLATIDDPSAAILEADVIIDLLATAWQRIGVPPEKSEPSP